MTLANAGLNVYAPADSSPAGPAETPAHQKLRQAAQEFEGMLISELLKDFHLSSLGGEPPLAGSDTLNSLAVQTLSNSMAARGGFGIAQMATRQLEPSLNHGQHNTSSTW